MQIAEVGQGSGYATAFGVCEAVALESTLQVVHCFSGILKLDAIEAAKNVVHSGGAAVRIATGALIQIERL